MAWENSLFIGCTHGDLVCDESIKVFKRFMEDWKPKKRQTGMAEKDAKMTKKFAKQKFVTIKNMIQKTVYIFQLQKT